MIIRLYKGDSSPDRAECVRGDGSRTETELSSNCVYHDLAHFAVESRMGFRDGYWGKIADGFDFSAYSLPDEKRPVKISEEGYHAEYLATLVQTAASSGGWNDAYENMLRTASQSAGLPFPDSLPTKKRDAIVDYTKMLYQQWDWLPVNSALELHFR